MKTNVNNTTEPQHDAKLPVSCRFYRGYTIKKHGYYPPDKCVWWEAVNDETGEADFHAHRLKDIIWMINEALGVSNGLQLANRRRFATT